MTRPMTRRLFAAALALVLFAGAPVGLAPTASAAPTLPPSVGNSVLFHLQLATDIDQYGNPVGQGNLFPEGTTLIFGLLGWNYVPAGTELRLRLFQGDRFAYETSHVVVNETGSGSDSAGFVFPFKVSSRLPGRRLLHRGGLQPRPGRDRPVHRGQRGAVRPGPGRRLGESARSPTRTRPRCSS